MDKTVTAVSLDYLRLSLDGKYSNTKKPQEFQIRMFRSVSYRSQEQAASRLSRLYVMNVVRTAAIVPLGME